MHLKSERKIVVHVDLKLGVWMIACVGFITMQCYWDIGLRTTQGVKEKRRIESLGDICVSKSGLPKNKLRVMMLKCVVNTTMEDCLVAIFVSTLDMKTQIGVFGFENATLPRIWCLR